MDKFGFEEFKKVVEGKTIEKVTIHDFKESVRYPSYVLTFTLKDQDNKETEVQIEQAYQQQYRIKPI